MSIYKNFKNVEKMRVVEKIKSVFYYQVLENFLIPNSCVEPKSVIRLLRANTLSTCHLPRRFSITMEPHCSLKVAEHLFKNKGCYHHNANDRFGLNSFFSNMEVFRVGVFFILQKKVASSHLLDTNMMFNYLLLLIERGTELVRTRLAFAISPPSPSGIFISDGP